MRISALLLFIVLLASCATHHSASRRDQAQVGITHVIDKGDTLYSLSRHYGLSVEEILSANNLEKNAVLQVGQPIYLPRVDPKSLVKGDKITKSEITKVDDGRGIVLSWPVEKGVVFRTFDQTPSRLHEGLSIGAPANTPVKVAQNGEVIFAAQGNNHLGRMVLVKHNEAFVSIYAHLDLIKVKVGQKLSKGDIIGTVGTSGGVESPRVYFELRKDRMPVNPEPYLSKPG